MFLAKEIEEIGSLIIGSGDTSRLIFIGDRTMGNTTAVITPANGHIKIIIGAKNTQKNTTMTPCPLIINTVISNLVTIPGRNIARTMHTIIRDLG
jgi:hypothetical protein